LNGKVHVMRKLLENITTRKREYGLALLEISLSILLSLTITAGIMILMGYPSEMSLVAYTVVFTKGFDNASYLFSRASPLILTALAFLYPALTGMFNIGGEGQLYVGAIASLVTALYTGSSLLALIAGGLAGAALGMVLALLRIYRNVNEVVAAIMINWALFNISMFVIATYLTDPSIPHLTKQVPDSAKLPVVDLGIIRLNTSFLVALASAIGGAYLFYRTKLGFAMRVSGLNPFASLIAGFENKKLILTSFALGGGMAGLGGSILVLGIVHRLDTMMMSLYGYGLLGIGASLLGRNNPVGVVVSSIFLSGLLIGGQWIETRLGLPHQVADLIIGIIVISLAIPFAYHYMKTFFRVRRK
jgi:ABC-type uncharacterized transport system permease subunit